VVEGAHWADICDVAGELGLKHFLDVGADFGGLAPASRAQIMIPPDLLRKPDAAGTMDTPVHMGDHQRPKILVLNSPLLLIIPGHLIPVIQRIVLQVALPALVADGAVQGVIGQDELHHAASGEPCGLGVGVDAHCGHHV
jgi:hypothetical protein